MSSINSKIESPLPIISSIQSHINCKTKTNKPTPKATKKGGMNERIKNLSKIFIFCSVQK